jgi:RND family efflux transporter MFP subunit
MDSQENHSSQPVPHSDHPVPHGAEDQIPTDLKPVGNWSVAVAAVIVVLCFAGLFVVGWTPHHKRQAELEQTKSENANMRPVVQTAAPQRSETSRDLTLPADVRPMQETRIFPRASGYLKSQLVDIGDQVKAGQLLAEIDAPDIDADLAQARASLGQAQAQETKAKDDFQLTQATLTRYESFAKTGGVTQQQLDEKRAAFTQAQSVLAGAQASIKASEANVQRLSALQGFEKVYAPFAGTVTARNYDIGALMTAGASSGRELFRITDVSTLRVFVNVPQSYVTSLAPGQSSYISVRNYPGKEFVGTITRSTGALDPATRTLSYEIDVPNDHGVLFAGMYGSARLRVSQAEPPMVIPTSALVFDSAGTRVWVVQDGKVFPKKVDLGRDFGTETEVATGLNGGEAIVTNPGERLAEGAAVELAAKPQEAAEKPALSSIRGVSPRGQ